MNWYTLRVISGKEKKVRENILFELDYEGMSDEVENILVPSEKIIEMKDGKKKIKNIVENISGVMNFVGVKGEPQALKEDEITRILGEVEGGEGREVVVAPYKVGDAVKVTDGPFAEFSGYVNEVNEDKQKVKVSVSIFGRPTPIELDFLQVELEK